MGRGFFSGVYSGSQNNMLMLAVLDFRVTGLAALTLDFRVMGLRF